MPHVELAQYADDTALVASSGSTKVLIKYLETCLFALDRWLRECRILINVDKSTTILFSLPRRHIPNPVALGSSKGRSKGSKQPEIWG